jgi:hypothetical protein
VKQPRLALAILSLTFFLPVLCTVALAAEKEKVPSPAEVKRFTHLLPKTPQGVGRPIGDRQAWEAVAKEPAFKGVVRAAEKLMATPIPELPDDLYLDFSRTGNRTRCQRVLSQRHSRFAALTLAECLENRGRFLPAIEEAIREVAAEKSWTLPAHDRRLDNFYGRQIDIDLASSTLSWNLATADYWLGDKLSKDTRDLIRRELERRTFGPYLGYLTAGKPRLWWPTCTSNWNAVCQSGVTGAALAVIDSPERRAAFSAAADRLIQYFLEGFTPDGYCSEGLGYWNYGFGHFVLLAETMYQATGGKVDWFENPKVQKIAQFGRRLEIVSGVYPAFADCAVSARPDVQIHAFVSRRYGLGWQDDERRGLLLAGGASDELFRFGVLRVPNSASAKPAVSQAPTYALRDWFSDAGILICRPASGTQGLGVALKGGHNAEHHNHNDVGSYVVASAGKTPLVDPGAEVYTARTFSADRYKSGVLNSFGHPVPRVAGKLQKAGREAAARVLKTEFADKTDTFVLDIRSAYDVKELQRLQRTFVFSRDGAGQLTVTDDVQFTKPQEFGTALVTFSKWRQVGEDQLVIGEGAEAVRVKITTDGAKFRLQPEEIHEDLHGKHIPIRIGIDLTEPVTQARVTVSVKPEKN